MFKEYCHNYKACKLIALAVKKTQVILVQKK